MVSKRPPSAVAFVWKTRTTTPKSGHNADQPPLMSYPLILNWALEYLDIWDIMRLIHTGNARCTAYIQQHCSRLHFTNDESLLEWRRQPTLSANAFTTILSLTHLTELSIISPTWKVPASVPRSPLEGLPKTLRHLAIWGVGHYLDDVWRTYIDFVNIDYATIFPELESLRLCSVTPHFRNIPNVASFNTKRLPPSIRVLSLLGFNNFYDADAYELCQPMDHEAEEKVVELSNQSVAPAAEAEPSSPKSALNHRFPHLEYFEWGGSYLVGLEPMHHPTKGEVNLNKLPLVMHTYKRVAETVLNPIPTSILYPAPLDIAGEDIESEVETPALALKTLVLEELNPTEQVYRHLPSSITSLRLLGIRRGTGMFSAINFMRFTSLQSVCCSMGPYMDMLATKLPDTVEKLTTNASNSTGEEFKAPPALTHLSAKSEGLLKFLAYMPPTITSMYLSIPGPERVFRQSVVQNLPPTLRILRLHMKTFPSYYIQLMPKKLEDLSITAFSMLYSDFIYDGKIAEFDISQLPPALTRLRLVCSPTSILLPASKLIQLPRSLKFLEISNVILSTSTTPPPSISAATGSSSASSSSSSSPVPKAKSKPGLFGKIAKLFAAAPPPPSPVTPQQLEYVLSMLPEDCWCNLGFSLDIDMNMVMQETSNLANFLPLFTRTLPAAIMIPRPPLSRHTDLQYED